jgi:cleavage and polyadenylation specificity factor subunit 3
VTSSSETLKKRVEGVLDMALTTISSLSESFLSGTPVIAEDVGLSQKDQIASREEKVDVAEIST